MKRSSRGSNIFEEGDKVRFIFQGQEHVGTVTMTQKQNHQRATVNFDDSGWNRTIRLFSTNLILIPEPEKENG